ncbi:hypothetical protein Pint_25695 [Pistacia integerrima]|uniref:Uncharacterized protein n=1 Tax=Pistacia integerrima TaxID=434235 RepID=A0ACC0YEV1_9ROSI|nr:hypothetical protein Pint_25695 [Pistacia integerrima]
MNCCICSCCGTGSWRASCHGRNQVDPPQKKEVRMKVLYSSICHTDARAWKAVMISVLGSSVGAYEFSNGDKRVGAACNYANVQTDSSVPIFGLGAIGVAGWGSTVLLGIHGSPRMLPLHPMELFDGRRIIGNEFITHELPFEKINEALQLLLDGKSLRYVLKF